MGFDPVSFLLGSKAGGGGGGVLVCHMDRQTGTLDHTWQEINDADFAVISFQIDEYNKYTMPVMYTLAGEHYGVCALMYDDPPSSIVFESVSADGYPVALGD